MKFKKIILYVGIFIFVFLLGLGGYHWFNSIERTESLSLKEKQWIEQNKNAVVDVVVLNNVPVFTSTGEGMLFNFIDSFEELTELSFNRVPFSDGLEMDANYRFVAKVEKDDSDIVLYEDNYAILVKDSSKYLGLDEIDNLIIGVYEGDAERTKLFLGDFEFVVVDSYDDLVLEEDYLENSEEAAADEETTNTFNAIVVPKLMMLDEIMLTNYNIAYDMSDMKLYYVLELAGNEVLNSIITKHYNMWSVDNYQRKFNENFNEMYFSKYRINEKEQTDFRSRRYEYGYYERIPYDFLIDNEMAGIHVEFLKDFSLKTGVEFKFISFNSREELVAGLENNDIDLMMTRSSSELGDDIFKTVPIYDSEFVVISQFAKNTVINSIASLTNERVVIGDNQLLEEKLTQMAIPFKKIDITKKRDRNLRDNVIVLDKLSFQFYREKYFKNYKIDHVFETENNTRFLLKDNAENKVFNNYFNFYLTFINNQELVNEGFLKSYQGFYYQNFVLYIVAGVSLILALAIFIFSSKYRKTRKIKNVGSKESKLKYIDLLTSLKNRNYLNDNISVWDNSGVYPQAIVIVDLNNVAYVNDNYGHAEGDNLIKEAANILISNQEDNSDIIRTSGNEFLIYLVGYDEKQIISFAKKIQKDLESLSHGFGAAVGYSVIEDEIKTIDDAINEATIDMRNKKVIE